MGFYTYFMSLLREVAGFTVEVRILGYFGNAFIYKGVAFFYSPEGGVLKMTPVRHLLPLSPQT